MIYKFLIAVAVLVSSISSQGDVPFVVKARQYHIDDSPYYDREPYGLIWAQAAKEAPIRLSLLKADTEFFPAIIPVKVDNSLDFERLSLLRKAKQSTRKNFAQASRVELRDDLSIWAVVEGQSSQVQVGELYENDTALFCTGKFRTVCGLERVNDKIFVSKPLDWSAIKISTFQEVKVEECAAEGARFPGQNLVLINPVVRIRLSLFEGHGTSCEELEQEMFQAVQIYGRYGFNLLFTTDPNSHFDVQVVSKIPEIENTGAENTSVSGRADVANKMLYLGKPTFGRRHPFTLAHEIGHLFGLEHSMSETNLMMGLGVSDQNSQLSSQQVEQIQLYLKQSGF